MVSRWARIQVVLKVKVKGHVIRALLCWHENRFFSQANGSIATKHAHDGLQVSLHPGCALGQGQGQGSCDTGTFVLDLKLLLLAGKLLDCDQTCTRWSTGEPASRVCSRSRSKVTWYRHFCARTKIASSRRQMNRLRPNLPTMVYSWACIQGVLKVKVKVKGHVIGHFCAETKIASSHRQIAGLWQNLHTMISRGRMHNTVVTATSKLKSIYDGVVFTSVCMTPS